MCTLAITIPRYSEGTPDHCFVYVPCRLSLFRSIKPESLALEKHDITGNELAVGCLVNF